MAFIQLADPPHQVHAGPVRHSQVEHDQVQVGQVGAHVGQQLRYALHHQRVMPGLVEGRLEPVTHEGRVGSHEHGLL